MFKFITKYFSTPTVEDLRAQSMDAAQRELHNCLNVLDTYEGKVLGLRKIIARMESKSDAKVYPNPIYTADHSSKASSV